MQAPVASAAAVISVRYDPPGLNCNLILAKSACLAGSKQGRQEKKRVHSHAWAQLSV